MSAVSAEHKKAIVQTVDEDRCRIGEELHDGLCQTLVTLRMLVERIELRSGGVPPEWIESLQSSSCKAVAQARALSRRLSPVPVNGTSLLDALQELAREAHAEFVCEKAVILGEEWLATAIFRITFELLAGADGRGTRVCLAATDSGAILRIGPLQVSRVPKAALELISTRAEAVGGRIEFRPCGEDGAEEIVCTLPFCRTA